MLDIAATAVRGILVSISGNLADARHKAIIDDWYPGGRIRYIRDPGVAEVFIKELVDETADAVSTALVPWKGEITIPDALHSQVAVYVNGEHLLTTEVRDL